VQVRTATIQIHCALLDRFARNRVGAGRRHDRLDCSFDEVLIKATSLIEQTKCGLHAMDDRGPLCVSEPLAIDTSDAIHHANVPSLREEGRVVDESPRSQQTVQTARLAVVSYDPGNAQHGRTSILVHSCFPGSYRFRPFAAT